MITESRAHMRMAFPGQGDDRGGFWTGSWIGDGGVEGATQDSVAVVSREKKKEPEFAGPCGSMRVHAGPCGSGWYCEQDACWMASAGGGGERTCWRLLAKGGVGWPREARC